MVSNETVIFINKLLNLLWLTFCSSYSDSREGIRQDSWKLLVILRTLDFQV